MGVDVHHIRCHNTCVAYLWHPVQVSFCSGSITLVLKLFVYLPKEAHGNSIFLGGVPCDNTMIKVDNLHVPSCSGSRSNLKGCQAIGVSELWQFNWQFLLCHALWLLKSVGHSLWDRIFGIAPEMHLAAHVWSHCCLKRDLQLEAATSAKMPHEL